MPLSSSNRVVHFCVDCFLKVKTELANAQGPSLRDFYVCSVATVGKVIERGLAADGRHAVHFGTTSPQLVALWLLGAWVLEMVDWHRSGIGNEAAPAPKRHGISTKAASAPKRHRH